MKDSGKRLTVWGIVLQPLGFIVGLAGMVTGILQAFAELGKHSDIRTEILVTHIRFALYTSAVGVIVSCVGGILLLIALFRIKYRASWFKAAMWMLAILWLLNIPVGTILGIIVMPYLSKHGAEFHDQASAQSALICARVP